MESRSSISRPVVLALALGGVQLAVRPAPLASQATDSVWVNTRSGVYHCPGTTYYGKTTRGVYLREMAARDSGYRPNGARRCSGGPTPSRDTVPTPFAGSIPVGDDRGPRAPAVPTEDCTLTRIVDADTFECATQRRVRLIGVSAPEARDEPFGSAATAALTAMLPMGAVVQLEPDTGRPDRYQRQLAYVWYKGEMVNWRLARDGWARAQRYPPDVRYATALDSAAARARRERRGLWSMQGFR